MVQCNLPNVTHWISKDFSLNSRRSIKLPAPPAPSQLMDLPHGKAANSLMKKRQIILMEMPLRPVWWTHASSTSTRSVHQHYVLSDCAINSEVKSNLLMIVYCWVSCVKMNMQRLKLMILCFPWLLERLFLQYRLCEGTQITHHILLDILLNVSPSKTPTKSIKPLGFVRSNT